jgi:hypothetical protein
MGKKNIYTCDKCDGRIVTLDVDEGTTPWRMRCRATEGCGGLMYSAGYEIKGDPPHTHEWYRRKIRGGMEQAEIDHIQRGGLDLRQVNPVAQSPIERWMRAEITTGKCAELMGIPKAKLEAIVTPMLFAIEAAVQSLKESDAPEAHSDRMLGNMSLCWCGARVTLLLDGNCLITHRSIQEIAAGAILAQMPIAADVLPAFKKAGE